eukprot:TRINITY_DN104724_c0_g1_i1.p1 TRINITY_DN104724_c0_g1~~TRINITY_DN104724_c0_g1_i1.p1  ORF type:complete len:516 (-),score=36.55 TRINITY_DN104724_c0_g1_i1:63-1610(-)
MNTAAALLLLCVPVLLAQDTLLAVQIVARHGDRTTWDFDPVTLRDWENWASNVWGTLRPSMTTPFGLRMLEEFGEVARGRWSAILPRRYDPGSISLRSSDKDRTIISGTSFVRGMYPGSYPAVHTVPDGDDILLRSWRRCPASASTIKRNLHRLDDIYRDFFGPNGKIRPGLIERVQRASGRPVDPDATREDTPTDLFEVLQDNVVARRPHGIPSPQILEDEFELMEGLTKIKYLVQYSLRGSGEPRGVSAAALLDELLDNFDTPNPKPLRYFSTHDFALFLLKDALGLAEYPLDAWARLALIQNEAELRDFIDDIDEHILPGYANSIVLELWNTPSGRQIRGFYGHPTCFTDTRACTDSLSYRLESLPLKCPTPQTNCRFDNFAEYIHLTVPDFFDPEKGCCMPTRDFHDMHCGTPMVPHHGMDGEHSFEYPEPNEGCEGYRKFCPETMCHTFWSPDQETCLDPRGVFDLYYPREHRYPEGRRRAGWQMTFNNMPGNTCSGPYCAGGYHGRRDD